MRCAGRFHSALLAVEKGLLRLREAHISAVFLYNVLGQPAALQMRFQGLYIGPYDNPSPAMPVQTWLMFPWEQSKSHIF